MTARSASTPASGPSRRAVATGLAWSVPAVAMVSAAPSFAASLRKDPGINGWVLNTTRDLGGCRYSLEVNSAPSRGGATPDGAPESVSADNFERFMGHLADSGLPVKKISEIIRGD